MNAAAATAVLGIVAAAALGSCERRAADAPVRTTASPVATATPTRATSGPAARTRPPAAGGVGILASAARAQAVVVGVVSGVAPVDQHGWRAELRVDRVLRGALALGALVPIAWEELSGARQVRFADGDRVLVVLDALPTQSLWRKRFPAARAPGVLVVAASGEAFLVRPDGATLDPLAHWLAMTERARAGTPGVARLAELVRGGHPAVAREALDLLAASPTRADGLGADGAASLLAAVRSPEREPAFRSEALRLAVAERLPGTREAAAALAADPGSPLRADAYRALAALPEGLAGEEVARLVVDAEPELRAVGVEVGGAGVARERIVVLLRDDPSPLVRLAAGRALVAREGSAASPEVVRLLDDPDAAVRNGIADTLGALGAPAVGPLAAVVDDGSERAALAAVLGLSRTGKPGGAMLSSIADTHRYESVRALARLALGEAPSHGHRH